MTPQRRQLEAALRSSKGKGAGGAPRAKWTADMRGRMHPSAGEAKWFDALYAAEARGEIAIEEIEPAFKITLDGQPLCTVKADARVRTIATGAVRVLDYKGKTGDTEISRLKRRMVLIQHGVQIEWVGSYVEAKARAKAKRAAARDLIRKSETRQRGKR